jgi:hypothetical protein
LPDRWALATHQHVLMHRLKELRQRAQRWDQRRAERCARSRSCAGRRPAGVTFSFGPRPGGYFARSICHFLTSSDRFVAGLNKCTYVICYIYALLNFWTKPIRRESFQCKLRRWPRPPQTRASPAIASLTYFEPSRVPVTEWIAGQVRMYFSNRDQAHHSPTIVNCGRWISRNGNGKSLYSRSTKTFPGGQCSANRGDE